MLTTTHCDDELDELLFADEILQAVQVYGTGKLETVTFDEMEKYYALDGCL